MNMLRGTSACIIMVVAYVSFVSLSCFALKVVTPAEGDQVIANWTYTVEWTGAIAGSRRYDIDLFYCGSFCTDNFCGDFVQALCPQNGCPDTAGDYDVLFPEPVGGNTSDGYVVRLQDVYAEADDAECSAPFTLVSSENMPVEGEQGGATLEVLLPGVNNNFTAGEDGVIEFTYNNGIGSSVDRFSIDLYAADSCGSGSPVAILCHKPDVGCRIADGDYEFTIPGDTPTGLYAVRVARFQTGSPADCSEPFQVSRIDSGIEQSGNAARLSQDVDGGSGSESHGTCAQVVVDTGDNATSYYSGIYDALGKASGRTRFVRVDNKAMLEFSYSRSGEQRWILTGLQTTIAVVSNATVPVDISCGEQGDGECWVERTDSGEVSVTTDVSCSEEN